jgi:antibiotic biosynthesis monooxygenase (ABM) superfamily enzyme
MDSSTKIKFNWKRQLLLILALVVTNNIFDLFLKPVPSLIVTLIVVVVPYYFIVIAPLRKPGNK